MVVFDTISVRRKVVRSDQNIEVMTTKFVKSFIKSIMHIVSDTLSRWTLTVSIWTWSFHCRIVDCITRIFGTTNNDTITTENKLKMSLFISSRWYYFDLLGRNAPISTVPSYGWPLGLSTIIVTTTCAFELLFCPLDTVRMASVVVFTTVHPTTQKRALVFAAAACWWDIVADNYNPSCSSSIQVWAFIRFT